MTLVTQPKGQRASNRVNLLADLFNVPQNLVLWTFLFTNVLNVIYMIEDVCLNHLINLITVNHCFNCFILNDKDELCWCAESYNTTASLSSSNLRRNCCSSLTKCVKYGCNCIVSFVFNEQVKVASYPRKQDWDSRSGTKAGGFLSRYIRTILL